SACNYLFQFLAVRWLPFEEYGELSFFLSLYNLAVFPISVLSIFLVWYFSQSFSVDWQSLALITEKRKTWIWKTVGSGTLVLSLLIFELGWFAGSIFVLL